MGDRAIIQLSTPTDFSPILYLHWGGGYVPSLLDEFYEQMKGRFDDSTYCFARLVGRACNRMDGDTGSTSVGVWNAEGGRISANSSQGDAGAFRVQLANKQVLYGGGYPPDVNADSPWTWTSFYA